MYKILSDFKWGSVRCRLYKPLLVMKLTLLLLTATFVQVSAATFAQKVTLKVKNASIRQVFEKIQAETNYDFLYSAEDIKGTHKVTLNVADMPLKTALDICFSNQPV